MMKRNRRNFLKLVGAAGISLAGPDVLPGDARSQDTAPVVNKVKVDHAVATLQDGSKLATPFWRIESGKDGPSLLLLAAQHGNEVQGVEPLDLKGQSRGETPAAESRSGKRTSLISPSRRAMISVLGSQHVKAASEAWDYLGFFLNSSSIASKVCSTSDWPPSGPIMLTNTSAL